ncbi:MAG: tetratricopeptide repeat protein [Pseudomonadota bacterium]
MRRADIQLLARARRGDTDARYEVGRRYLMGTEGFPKHIPSGIEHLTHPSLGESPLAARVIAETLPLEDIVAWHQVSALERAAREGSAAAQLKLEAWLRLMSPTGAAEPARALLQRCGGDCRAVGLLAAQQALAHGDLQRFSACLQSGLLNLQQPDEELTALVVRALQHAEGTGQTLQGLDVRLVEQSLERHAGGDDHRAVYMLGRALCGTPCGPLQPADLVASTNVRKGAALLMRAADRGVAQAWIQLHALYADRTSSVANPQMARFFLEKAAACGNAQAQRRLGALLLREAKTVAESETAIQWLSKASRQGDDHATLLLRSLVLPLAGNDADAAAAVEEVRRDDPWLAKRMQVSRHFGLTRHEALCFDPVSGLRSWGLLVGRNPFVHQPRIAAPRAVPAVSSRAMESLRGAASFFAQTSADVPLVEGDFQRRVTRQRRVFERHRVQEEMFFSQVSSKQLDALRIGPKWAVRERGSLQAALSV